MLTPCKQFRGVIDSSSELLRAQPQGLRIASVLAGVLARAPTVPRPRHIQQNTPQAEAASTLETTILIFITSSPLP